jgi:hypothetical protein
MMVRTAPKPGREAEYNRWYDEVHLAEICAIPGFVSARRFDALEGRSGWPDVPYLALYEIEADDPQVPMAELRRRSAAGEIQASDALDRTRTVSWLYAAR